MGTRHLYWILTGPSFAVCLKVFVRNYALGDPMTFILAQHARNHSDICVIQ
jgi:hypothetical protein